MVERIMKNGNDPVLEFGLQDGYLLFHMSVQSGVQTLDQDPEGEIENSGKNIFEIQNQNFCYIQVIVFDLRLYQI